MDFSVVIPVYNEEHNIPILYDRLNAVLSKLGKNYEIILINDGSRDQSEQLLNDLYKKDPQHLRIIHFNGNFGQHMAIMAGFEKSIGKTVITLDADLQNPPEEIPALLGEIDKGHDIVEGVRQARQDSAFRRYASRLNNWIREKTTGIRLQDQGSMLRAYDRRVIDLMLLSKERSTFIPALAYSYASNPGFINVKHSERNSGQSKYSVARLMRLHFDLMAGFSSAPLQFVTFAGISVSVLSFLFFIYMILRRIIIGPEAEGLFTLFAIQFFLLGLLLFSIGIVGEYIGRIYLEVRKRPRFVIKNFLSNEKSDD